MTTPYVDPKGHVVPMVSVTNDDLPTIQTEDVSDDHELPEPAFRLSAVPNFSRQLPLRLSQSNDESASSGTEERHLAPLRPSGFPCCGELQHNLVHFLRDIRFRGYVANQNLL